MKVLISKEVLKKEVKSIKKTSNLKYTQIYQTLLEMLGFENNENYENEKSKTFNKNVLSLLSFPSLYHLEENT